MQELQTQLIESQKARQDLAVQHKAAVDESAELSLMLKAARNTIAAYRATDDEGRAHQLRQAEDMAKYYKQKAEVRPNCFPSGGRCPSNAALPHPYVALPPSLCRELRGGGCQWARTQRCERPNNFYTRQRAELTTAYWLEIEKFQ